MAWVKDGYAQNLQQGDILGLLGNVGEGVGREMLGVDDFIRVYQKAKKGDFLGALKSLGAGALELGTTIIPGGQVVKAAKLGKAFKGGKVASGLLRSAGLMDEAGMIAKSSLPLLRGYKALDWGRVPVGMGAETYKGWRGAQAAAANSQRNAEILNAMLRNSSPQAQALSYLSNYGGM